jgi:hypothetical protein
MAQLFSASIDVTKFTKDKFVKGQKGTYANVTISINDEPDQYGNILTITESQTQEEREAKASKIYLANGKLVWSSEGGSTAKAAPSTPTPPPAAAPVVEEGDELPF